MAQMYDENEIDRDALLSQMAGAPAQPSTPTARKGTFMSRAIGKLGVPRPSSGGGMSGAMSGTADALSPNAEAAAARRNDPANPLGAMVNGIAPGEPSPAASKPQGAPDLQSYLTSGLQSFRPELLKIQGQGDDARKTAVQDHIRKLLAERPDLASQVSDVRGEKINVGGRWIDTLHDVANGAGGGAAEVQWLVEDPNAAAAPMAAAQGGPSAFQGIQSLMPTDTDFYQRLQAQLQSVLGGPQATDRDALLRMMSQGAQ
jgi:hypothetical protein